MLHKIPSELLELYSPLSPWESFYLRTRWRLCPYGLVEMLLPKRGKVLDFGCGYGLLSNYLSLRSGERNVVGIDLDKNRIHVAERTLKKRRNITFHLADISELDITQLDAVVMTDVLHHIDHKSAGTLLEKISNALSAQGILAILDVDIKPFWKFCITYAIDRLLNPKSQLFYRPVDHMQKLLESHLLRVERLIPAHQGLPLSDILYFCRKEDHSIQNHI